jgi:hypothetical protein
MSKQAWDAFREELEREEALRSDLTRVLSAGGTKATASFDELVAFAKARGYEFTADEALGRGELSDGDLDRVVGGGDPTSFGDWIADVEQPTTEFRGRYQLRLDTAKTLLSAK